MSKRKKNPRPMTIETALDTLECLAREAKGSAWMEAICTLRGGTSAVGRPMETAPKDLTRVLLWADAWYIGAYDGDTWRIDSAHEIQPLLWEELPPDPLFEPPVR